MERKCSKSNLWNKSVCAFAPTPEQKVETDKEALTDTKNAGGCVQVFLHINTSMYTHLVSSESRRKNSKMWLHGTMLCNMQEYLLLTCLTCRPWLHILSKRSHRLAIRVFSSTPVIFTSPWPSSTASRPIFSTNILLVLKRTKQNS